MKLRLKSTMNHRLGTTAVTDLRGRQLAGYHQPFARVPMRASPKPRKPAGHHPFMGEFTVSSLLYHRI